MNWFVALIFVPMLLSSVQTPATAPHFEVVSIKPNVSGGVGGTGLLRPQPGGRLTGEGVLPRFFIQTAYGLKAYQVSSGPGWLDTDRFDIQAKADGNPSPDEMQKMMQQLLEDYFQFKAHREARTLPVYDLSLAKSGLKLETAKEGSCVTPDPSAGPVPLPPPPPAKPGQPAQAMRTVCGRPMVSISQGMGQLNGGKLTMPDLIRVLSSMLGRTVIDKTGFTQAFDVHLEFVFDQSLAGVAAAPGAPPTPSAAAEPLGPSIFTAMQEQLGLKLDSARGPVEVLVIDRVEKPSLNQH